MTNQKLRYTTRSFQENGRKVWQVYDQQTCEVIGSGLSKVQARRWAERLNATGG